MLYQMANKICVTNLNINANYQMYPSRQPSDSVTSRLNVPAKYIVKIQYFVVNNLHWLHAGLDCCVGLVEIKSSSKYIVKIQYFVVNNLHWLHAGLDCCVGLVEIKSSSKYIVKIQYFVVNNLHWLHAGLDCCVGFCAGSGPGGAKP